MQPEKGELLRIFISEADQHEGKPLYEWIMQRAQETGMAGATVFRGVEGFGADKKMHTSRILTLSHNLPILIEIVDSVEKINGFIAGIEEMIEEGLITSEPVTIRMLRKDRAVDDP